MSKKILCTICVRKGSKGLKNKNIKIINNQPLFLITLKQAIKSEYFNKITVNSDSSLIKKIANSHNVFFLKRKKKLSGDNVSKIDVIKNSLIETEKKYQCKYDIIVDLDVTSPLRSVNDISNAINFFLNSKYKNVVSGSVAKKNPFFNQVIMNKNKIKIVCKNKRKINSRQQSPKVFDLNASIYIWERENLIKSLNLINKYTGLYKMRPEKSFDIDSELDFKIVKFILKNKLNR